MTEENNLLVIPNDHNKNYKTISLLCVLDPDLSWKAKGIHNYLITRPSNWAIRKADLEKRSLESKGKLDAGINELIKKR